MTKFLVSGANGFVGSALCDTLQQRHIDVVAAVRKVEKAGQLAVGNLDDKTQWGSALEGVDAVIHLAARVHVMNDTASDPLALFRAINVDMTLNLARQAALAGVKRFVFVSSVKVNGEQTFGRPYASSDAPMPMDPYGQSKMEAEAALRVLAKETGMELVIVRPPLVYGPGVRANFRRLMQLQKTGLPLPFASVSNQRSMDALDNLVDLLILAAQHPAAAGECFMVSDDHDVSIAELLQGLAKSMEKRSLLFPFPPKIISLLASSVGKSAEANRFLGSLQVDITHTKKCLGWKPIATLQQSLDKTVAHFLTSQ